MLDETIINQAYENLMTIRVKVYNANVKLIDAQSKLATSKIENYAAGRIDGKNETDRKAQYAEYCMAENDMVEEAEKDIMLVQFKFDLATYEVNRINTLIKWLSI